MLRRFWNILARLFGPRKSPPLLPCANLGPYKTVERLESEVPVSRANNVMVIVGHNQQTCPLCGGTGGDSWASSYRANPSRLCTPFRREVLKHKLFHANIRCRLAGAHYHCRCLNPDCRTQWIVMSKDVKWTDVTERIELIDKTVARMQQQLSKRQADSFVFYDHNDDIPDPLPGSKTSE